MHANSNPVSSAQTGVHDQLAMLVARHARAEFRKPVTDYNRAAFARSLDAWHDAGRAPLILDAGCGVGLSTLHLAAQYPDHFVIGVDQSAHRLARNVIWDAPIPPNFIRVRADLVDFWRLMLASGVRPKRHYILYPNPWPKIGHLARRWHGHAVFPTIVALGGELECRSNWEIYIEEFATALSQFSGQEVGCERYATERPITPFEQKYIASGHTLWRCKVTLG
ncbi:MAG TPA: SAM-dependent methyltransferase [Noviherbaspirillum sp.]|nr:SAM-dependent methyltransferase [Noviherbaspirillum sp.]